MKIYQLLKLYRKIKNPRVKLCGILALHLSGRRYINVFIDPAMACNLRCRMCYFSDEESRKGMHGTFNEDDINAIARSLFGRTLKLQIGCGAEPTTSKLLNMLVKTGKDYGIPYIALTTNGNLLDYEALKQLVKNGLDEITISTHGFTKDTYEGLMTGAKFEAFLRLVDGLRRLRHEYPDFNIRVNYTINEDNVDELSAFPEIFNGVAPNVLQIRPVQKIGESAYNNFSLGRIYDNYERFITPVVDYCNQNDITCLYPKRENLVSLMQVEESHEDARNSIVDSLPYFYVAPYDGWKDKLNPYEETFEDYCRRTHRTRFILRNIFGLKRVGDMNADKTKVLNYKVK